MDIGISILFVSCVILSNWHGYKKGQRKGRIEGIEGSMDLLIDTGRIDVLDAIATEKTLGIKY